MLLYSKLSKMQIDLQLLTGNIWNSELYKNYPQ